MTEEVEMVLVMKHFLKWKQLLSITLHQSNINVCGWNINSVNHFNIYRTCHADFYLGIEGLPKVSIF